MVTILLLLLVAEGLSRLFLKQTYPHILNDNGEITSIQIEPGNPDAGLISNFHGQLESGEYHIKVQLNKWGFRAIPDSEKKGKNAINVLLLGDSFMFGWGVEVTNSFGYYLKEHLQSLTHRNVHVTNLSIPGTGQFTELKNMKKFISSKPDIVICGVYLANHLCSGNDLIDNLNARYKANTKLSGKLEKTTDKISFLRKTRRVLKKHSNLFRFLEARIGSFALSKFSGSFKISKDEKVMQKSWWVTDSLLCEMKNEAQLNGAKFIIQYIPNMIDVAQQNHQAFRKLQKFVDSQQMFIAPDPITLFRQKQRPFSMDRFYYLVDGHWKAGAHRLAAEAMAEFIKQKIINR